MNIINKAILWLITAVPVATTAYADYSDLSMEELVNTPVVKTTKQTERLFDAATSAFVFDEEAIAFLPVDSIPELLRYAPGTNIMRPSNGVWEVGIRGTNMRYFTRSIFGVDEQNLYGSVFGGLFGSQHDIPMDDIASIEVVYGSGGSIWTTNAVNGMINVILKPAFETEGSLLKTQIGSKNRKLTARTGWAISDKTSARVYASYGERQPGDSPLFEDYWRTSRVGYQSDTRFSSRDLLTISAEAYTSELGEFKMVGNRITGDIMPYPTEEEQKGYNAQIKWTHQDSQSNGYTLRAWTGYSDFRNSFVDFTYAAFGAEFKGRMALSDTHEFFLSSSLTQGKFDFADHWGSSFSEEANDNSFQVNASLQYDYHLIPDSLTFSTGLGIQHDDTLKETNSLPSFRIVYHINERSRLWASFSRVYRRVPQAFRYAEYLEFMSMPIPPTTLPTPMGDLTFDRAFIYARSTPDLVNERMDTIEAGYRYMINTNTEFFVNTFYSKLDKGISVFSGLSQPELGFGSEHFYLKQYLELYNAVEATAWGGEVSLKTNISSETSILLNYSFLNEDSEYYPEFQNIPDSMAIETSGISPKHQASIWVSHNWRPQLRSDVGMRYSGAYSNLLGTQDAITQLDLRLSWLPNDNLSLSLVGRNLLDNDINTEVHRDFLTYPVEEEPEWYLELKWNF